MQLTWCVDACTRTRVGTWRAQSPIQRCVDALVDVIRFVPLWSITVTIAIALGFFVAIAYKHLPFLVLTRYRNRGSRARGAPFKVNLAAEEFGEYYETTQQGLE